MLHAIRRAVVGLAASALLTVAGSGAAFAASPAPTTTPLPVVRSGPCATAWQQAHADPSVANLDALGDCEIGRRFATLDTLGARIAAAANLTAADRSALAAELAATRSGLAGLKATIDADSTVGQLRTDLPKIATDYRVYLLVVPQVHLVIAADAETAAVARLRELSTDLAARIARAQAAGRDVTGAQADLAAMNGAITDAAVQVQGLSAQLLTLTPARWNAGAAGPVLQHARSMEVSAHDLLRAARADAAACLAALR